MTLRLFDRRGGDGSEFTGIWLEALFVEPVAFRFREVVGGGAGRGAGGIDADEPAASLAEERVTLVDKDDEKLSNGEGSMVEEALAMRFNPP